MLVNNAGIARDQLMLRMKREDWDAVIATNLTAAFALTQAVLKPMIRQKRGRIICISSVVGQSGNAGQANYAASKAGLIGFAKAVALEVASRNITVNVVAPGLIETDMTRDLTADARETWASRIPLRRLGGAGRRGGGGLLSRVRRGVVYYGTGAGRQRWDVHVARAAPSGAPAGAARGVGGRPASDGDWGSGGAKPPGLRWRAEWPSQTR